MSLIFPAYLLGLLGLALPWILHRFSDQKPPELLFPSKQFLEATTPPVSRKRTLRYRALLALRALALILLCLLFAQPWIKNNPIQLSEQLHHMIVVDQSLSMRADDRWASAQQLAQQIMTQIGDASAQLIGFDTRVTVLGAAGQTSLGTQASLSSVLDDMQPGFAPADYGLLMQRLDRLASEQELPVKVWLISDMQQSSLPAQVNALYAQNVKEIELLPIDTDGSVNVHLVAAAESGNGATASISVSLFASVSGDEPLAEPIERTITVGTADETIEQRTISLTPGELFVMRFDELVLPAQADPEFVVSILEPDALADDNRHRLPVTQRQATGIVLLNEPGERVGSSSVFLATALETNSLAEVETINGTTLQISPDTPHLVTGRDLSEPLGQDVLQFVDGGNNALVFNRAGTTFTQSASIEGSGVGSMDEAHPLALGDMFWPDVEFYDLPSFDLADGDRVLLQTSEGQSVLIERPTNRGRLLILNDPLDGLASNLPLQSAFVTLMQSMVRYFDASTSVPSQIVIGERLALPPNVQLIDSSGKSLLELSAASSASTVALDTPGLYTVVSARGDQSLRAVLDADEANLASLTADTLAAWQSRYADDASAVNDADTSETTALSDMAESGRQGLWQWLLPLAALLFISEGWFANRRLDVRRDGS